MILAYQVNGQTLWQFDLRNRKLQTSPQIGVLTRLCNTHKEYIPQVQGQGRSYDYNMNTEDDIFLDLGLQAQWSPGPRPRASDNGQHQRQRLHLHLPLPRTGCWQNVYL